MAYATKRGLLNPQATYDAVAGRLPSDHPLLTRAVLVRRLVDVASGTKGLPDLLNQIGNAPQHYFFQFVNTLVEREAHEKWIDLSGEPHQSLLTVEEHHELLSRNVIVACTRKLRFPGDRSGRKRGPSRAKTHELPRGRPAKTNVIARFYSRLLFPGVVPRRDSTHRLHVSQMSIRAVGNSLRYEVSSVLDGCEIAIVARVDRDEQIFDPVQIRSYLAQIGFHESVDQAPLPLAQGQSDEELWLVERVMRIFLRANQVNEDVIRMKLGVKASTFFDSVLPRLFKAGMLEVIPYLGHGSQRRFRLRIQMQDLHNALAECGGDFERFLTRVTKE